MVKRIAFVVVFVLAIVSFAGIVSAQVPKAVPAGMDITTYPILPEHVMTVAEMAKYGLHPLTITKVTPIDNFSHKVNAFLVDELRPGDIAAANNKGELVYKANCSNRVDERKPCPICAPVPPLTPTSPPAPPPAAGNNPRVPSTGGYSMPGWLRSLWYGIGNLFWLLLALAALALLLILAYLLGRWLMNLVPGGRHEETPPERVTPPARTPVTTPVQPVVTPPATQPVPAPAGPVPVLTTTTQRYGPFKKVSVSDRQTDGYHVAGDGRELGVFKNPVTTEDVGLDGHYVVVTTTT